MFDTAITLIEGNFILRMQVVIYECRLLLHNVIKRNLAFVSEAKLV